MSHLQNIARIKAIYSALEELGPAVVFVGGAVISLYAERLAGETRPTDDIDIVIELLNYTGYAEVEEKLRSKGFVNDVESGVLCRYTIQGITVDIMPTQKGILGFANQWYPEGYASAISTDLGNNCTIQIFQAPYFIASKIEAFHDRGQGDGRLSTDFEDIVYVLNTRRSIWDEFAAAPPILKAYLQDQFSKLLATEYLYEWISVHLDYAEQSRTTYIIGGLQHFVG